MLSDRELIRLVSDSYNETSIVLAERLNALLGVEEQLEDAKREIVELTASREYWRIEATDAQDALEALQAQLEAK
jgi:hypothetical protein